MVIIFTFQVFWGKVFRPSGGPVTVSNCVLGSSSIIRHRHTERKIIEKSGEECNLRIFQSNSGLEKAIWKQSNVVLCYHVLSSFYRSYFTRSSLTYYVVAAALMDLHLCSFRQNYFLSSFNFKIEICTIFA